jgi:hypothetical protein
VTAFVRAFASEGEISRLAMLCLTALIAPSAWAHPGPGIVVDQKGQVFFVHPVRHRIMKVDTKGELTVFVQGVEGHQLSLPHHLFLDSQDNLYSVGDRDGVIWRIAADAKLTRIYPSADGDGINFIGRGGGPFLRDPQGRIYGIHSLLDEYTQILKVDPNGRIHILAGGDYGIADGRGPRAKFANLHVGCFALSPDGSLYVTDSLTCVREISPTGAVTTLADSSGVQLQFKGARGLACDSQGNLYVADESQRRIYKISTSGNLSVLAGSGERGSEDGPPRTASFLQPVGVAVRPDGTIYVLDYMGDHPRVRKISSDATVTTINSTTHLR